MTDTLLDRFLRYVRVNTQADERSTTYPSSPGQLELGRTLRDELAQMGLTDARQTEHGIVYATIPSNVSDNVPTVALIAHVDTSPEFSGRGVNPQLVRDYRGGDIALPNAPGRVITTAANPELANYVGKTLVTTDGTTLLGADDKAGVAVIMEVARTLTADPTIPHGPVRICFTCDEEIGKGVAHVDLAELAADVAYTLEGAAAGEVEAETFAADKATITIVGVNTHPSAAKGKMTNAVRLAGLFLERLPQSELSPETTEGREGFIHPYVIEGGVPETKIHCLLRDFEVEKLTEQAALIRSIAADIGREYPAARITVDVKPQYRNMRDGMAKEPRAVPHALEAIRRAGFPPRQEIIRGGTDGSRLTEMGLPTPNLSTGEHNLHSPLEWACVEEMADNVRIVVELLKVWAGK